MADEWFLIWGGPCLGGIFALIGMIFGLKAWQQSWRLGNLPTSKAAGVCIGLTEMRGTAETEQLLTGFLSGQSYVIYGWSVNEHWSRTVTEHYTDSKGRSRTRTRHESGWTEVSSGIELPAFYLQDETGVLRIQPANAEFDMPTLFEKECGPQDPLYYGKGPRAAVSDSDHRRCFSEIGITLHTPLYVVGQAREREDIAAAEIAYDKRAPLFVISTKTEQQVLQSFSLRGWVLAVIGGLLWIGGFAVRYWSMDTNLYPGWGLYIGIIAGYVLLWSICWGIMLYNGFMELSQRVQQAWSNIDVHLKRRYDLIPQLAAVIEGFSGHERSVQGHISALRAQQTATLPGLAGPDPVGCLATVRAVAEAYPQLKADTVFLRLQKDLSDTEERIALARSYFNEIASYYNARLSMVPDGLFAKFGGLQPQALWLAETFERAEVKVQLAA